MSFRELKNFCESMRALSYHRPISVENFRTPNFELVADLLDWLLHRYDPNVCIPDDISTEQCRVEFIKDVTEKIYMRTGLRLNTKQLYRADGYAVKELLKLAKMLYDAQRSVDNNNIESKDDFTSAKLQDLKTTRSICTTIVDSGVKLYDLLGKEDEYRPEREKAIRFLDGISRNLDSNSEHEQVERALNNMLQTHQEKLVHLRQLSDELSQDEKNLDGKIKKKKQELERCNKRLASLTNVRPAFMDEYEKLEYELERVYETYISRFRNLDYLEHELDSLNKEEEEKMEENERALKRMQKRLREEEWRMLRGEGDDERKQNRGENRVQGGMQADEDVSDSDVSSESDPISLASSNSAVSLGHSSEDILDESEESNVLHDSDDDRPKSRGDHDF
eukprot:GEMP01036560.1.p1 GENE.GEMP01036560.1~~GEMP01036560.1.p1  ORF type:complete len:430 (+),score=78.83 GEMP01036560.1:114-1292(+)